MRKPPFLVLSSLLWSLALAAGAAVAAEDDRDIAQRVTDGLRASAVVGLAPIRVEVTDGRVVLTGRVRTLLQKWDARDVAEKARGVIALDNRIEVDARRGSDDAVAQADRRRFGNLPLLSSSSVRVECDQGVVTLRGTLGRAGARFAALRAAAEADGVVDVVDRLASGPSDDKTILNAIVERLGLGSLVRVVGDVEPQVKDGVVTLRGTVFSLYDREQAERLVLEIDGVREVVNGIEVRPRNPRLEIPLR